jgi:hypothetical protein
MCRKIPVQEQVDDKQGGEYEARVLVIEKILTMPVDELFSVKEVKPDIPLRAKIFTSVQRAICGEMVAGHQAGSGTGNLSAYRVPGSVYGAGEVRTHFYMFGVTGITRTANALNTVPPIYENLPESGNPYHLPARLLIYHGHKGSLPRCPGHSAPVQGVY